jgi:valyl-tRNA synthetase
VFDGFENPDNADIKYYYPTQDLVTAPEILFFWVARMIMAGIEFKHEIPFSTVYLTGIVRDKLGRKMSKSLGNSPDPLDLIQQFGADGVRMGMLLCSPAGNDILFDESQVEQGRNFANKLWNAFRLVKGWQVDEQLEQPSLNLTASNWIQEKLHITIATTEKYYSEYRLSDAMMTLYKFIWDDFCSWYLEMIKPVYGSPIDRKSYQEAIVMLENIVKLLHPIMPFITEEIWQALGTRTLAESLIVAEYPKYDEKKIATALSSKAEMAFGIITEVRNIRSKRGMSPKEALNLMIKTGSKENYGDFLEVMKKLGNLTAIEFVETAPPSSVSFLIEKDECFVPLEMNDQDAAAEKQRIKEEMEYLEGFMKSVQTKLGNERFVANAKPEIVENERKKMADAESKLNTLRDSLTKLNG